MASDGTGVVALYGGGSGNNKVKVVDASSKSPAAATFSDKACPKDDFPLPRIDRVVDDAANSQLMSLLDCFSGYSDMDEKRR